MINNSSDPFSEFRCPILAPQHTGNSMTQGIVSKGNRKPMQHRTAALNSLLTLMGSYSSIRLSRSKARALMGTSALCMSAPRTLCGGLCAWE